MGNAKVASSSVVVNYGRCILEKATAKELGLLHIGQKVSPMGGN